MNFDIKKVKIEVTVPKENANVLRDAMFEEGAGVIGNYTHCSTSINTIGTFKPNSNARPYIGKNGNFEVIEEEKLQVVCDVKIAKRVIDKLRKVHPYEEPVVDIIPVISEEDLI